RDRLERHRALVAVYEASPGLSLVHHLLAAGEPARALDRLAEVLVAAGDSHALRRKSPLNAAQIASILAQAVDGALALGRRPREVNDLRRWLTSLSVTTEEAFYWRSSRDWLAQIKHDAGLDLWEQLAPLDDPAVRCLEALRRASERYEQTPE